MTLLKFRTYLPLAHVVARLASPFDGRARKVDAPSCYAARPSRYAARPSRYAGLSAPEATGDINRLRILIFTSEAPPVVSGISKTVALLERGLTSRGHSVDIVSRGDFPKFIRDEIRLSSFGFFWPRLRPYIKSYDVVNVHGPVPTLSEIFLILSRTLHRRNRPAVVYTHHCDIAIARWVTICRIYNWVAGRVAHAADRVIVSSLAYQEKLTEAGEKSVDLIPWAVDSVLADEPRPPRREGELRVLFVGQLREYKGVNVLLDAVHEAEQLQVSIVGDGPLRDEMQARVAAPGLEHVTMLGRLSDADLKQAYNENDVVVLPSITTAEAYGLVLAEGMTAGCVPVASDLPGVREVAAPTGIIFPPSDAPRLRAAFERLRTDHDELERKSAQSLIRSQEFSVESMSRRYEESFLMAIRSAQAEQRTLVLPESWDEPRRLFDQLADLLGPVELSLSVVSRRRDVTHAHIWTMAPYAVKAKAPVARYVAGKSVPMLISTPSSVAADLRPLLARPELSSSMLLPIRRDRRSVSVLSVSTRAAQPFVLRDHHIELVLDALAGVSARRPRVFA